MEPTAEENFMEVTEFPELTADTLDQEESKLITEQLQFLNKISADLYKSTLDVMQKEKSIQLEKLEITNG